MKFLVTGGAGFIGSNIVEELVKQGYEVRILDDFSTGKIENIEPFLDKTELVRGDIRNDQDLKQSLDGIDFVLHQAALRSVPRSVDDPISTNDVNITGTLKLLFFAKQSNVKRVVYASSSSVYGDCNKFPQKEIFPTVPVSPYATSKLAGENYCYVFAKTFGLETVSLRYFNVYGPRQNPESKYAAVVPKFIESALNGKPFEIHGTGKQSRDFTYIDNVVSANILACFAKKVSGETFNVACNKSHSVLDIANTIEKILNKKLPKNHVPLRPGDVKRTFADISKTKKMLKYTPSIKLYEGLEKTVNWFKENVDKR